MSQDGAQGVFGKTRVARSYGRVGRALYDVKQLLQAVGGIHDARRGRTGSEFRKIHKVREFCVLTLRSRLVRRACHDELTMASGHKAAHSCCSDADAGVGTARPQLAIPFSDPRGLAQAVLVVPIDDRACKVVPQVGRFGRRLPSVRPR